MLQINWLRCHCVAKWRTGRNPELWRTVDGVTAISDMANRVGAIFL